VLESTDAALAGCQVALTRTLQKCADEHAKAFNACKKSSLKLGTIHESVDLQPCVGADAKGKVTSTCDASLGRVRSDLDRSCVTEGVDLTAAFPGCAEGGVQPAADCLERTVACRTCSALSAADNIAPDCDLDDDASDNNSCP